MMPLDGTSGITLRNRLPHLRERFASRLTQGALSQSAGLLTGAAGILLTHHALNASHPVCPGWDTCLLLV
ncbi:hypothetical protein GCM10010389_13230 [Streptomyces echinoruber]|uniref:Uncharacterized protein n=1 Tax=Streptomyces echinoruber TaxID=68898 RepID=A0A918QX34_9ACTN|nr:hypothetical protein GCM10010389_13230 [Streptomyces echinoruber]